MYEARGHSCSRAGGLHSVVSAGLFALLGCSLATPATAAATSYNNNHNKNNNNNNNHNKNNKNNNNKNKNKNNNNNHNNNNNKNNNNNIDEVVGPYGPYAWDPKSMTVVLPCANEGAFSIKTVKSVYEQTPSSLLVEIIVVDDASYPALQNMYFPKKVREKYGVKVMRNEEMSGLIKTKKRGGDAAVGDIIVFFDCHVAPQPGWYKSVVKLMSQNYRRIIVPIITDLDIDTWTQRGRGSDGSAKCYSTFDADFKWYTSDNDFVPVLSGGLLAISKRWWQETGGYDDEMIAWGGENIDQSLRSWLCGGEIMVARDSFVAHMWRMESDPRTISNFHIPPGSSQRNRLRAANAWFGDFAPKLMDFPNLAPNMKGRDGLPWYGDLENILKVKRDLKCQDFGWFAHRFKEVYIHGGLIPRTTNLFRSDGNAPSRASSGFCLEYLGPPGTSYDGTGQVGMRP
ncbi:unnamed protein product, partial [Polarella glacialis]